MINLPCGLSLRPKLGSVIISGERERLLEQHREIADVVGEDQDQPGVEQVALRVAQALVRARSRPRRSRPSGRTRSPPAPPVRITPRSQVERAQRATGSARGVEAAEPSRDMLVGPDKIGQARPRVVAVRARSSGSRTSWPMSHQPHGRSPAQGSSGRRSKVKPGPSASRSQVSPPVGCRIGASGTGAPSRAVPANALLVRRRERRVVDRGNRQPPGIHHPARESASARDRARRCGSAVPSECGAMKSVERVEWPMFSSAAACARGRRSSSSAGAACPPARPQASRRDSRRPARRNCRRARRTARPDARCRRRRSRGHARSAPDGGN